MTDQQYRRAMVSALLSKLAANLSNLSTDQLRALLDASAAGRAAALPTKALRAQNQAAVVYVDGGARKESAIAAVRQVADWLEKNWDGYHAQLLDQALRKSTGKQASLPN